MSSMELCNIVKTFEELEKTRKELCCQNEQLMSTISCLNRTVDKLEKVHKKDNALVCKHETTIENLKKEIKDLQCTIQRKSQDIAECGTLYKALKNLEKVNDLLLKDKENCEDQLCKFKDNVSKLEGKLQEKDCLINMQANQLGEIQENLRDYKCKFKNLEKENDLLLKDKEKCEAQLCKLKDTVTKLEGKLQEKDCVINMQANQLEEIKEKLRDYKCKFEDLFKETRASREQKECTEKLREEFRTEKEKMCDKLEEFEVIKFKLEDMNKKNQCYIKKLKKELAMETDRNAELCAKQNLAEEEGKEKNCLLKQLQDTVGHLTRKLNAKENEMCHCLQELERKKEEFMRYKNTICGIQDKVCKKPEKLKCCIPKMDSFYCPCHITNSQPTLQRFSYIKSRKSFFDRLFREHNDYLLNTPKRFRNPESNHEQHCCEKSSEKTVTFDEKTKKLLPKCERNKCDAENNKKEQKTTEKNKKQDEGDNENDTKPSEATDKTVGNCENNKLRSKSHENFVVTSKDRKKDCAKSHSDEKSNNRASKSKKDMKSNEQECKIEIHKKYVGKRASRSRSRKRHKCKNPFVQSKSSHFTRKKKCVRSKRSHDTRRQNTIPTSAT